ncbi:hypothetical protein D7W09_04765 [bacterium D16-34]|nr:hypothetical protein D7W09_04765 [bacterium D16-34]
MAGIRGGVLVRRRVSCSCFAKFGVTCALVLGMLPLVAFAEEAAVEQPDQFEFSGLSDKAFYTEGDYQYSISNGQVTIQSYQGNAASIQVPQTIKGYPVTSIADYAFMGKTNLRSVTIPEGVVATGKMLFASSSVEVVNMPSTWKSYYLCMFSNCLNLVEINVPNNHPTLSTYCGDLYNKDKSVLIFYAGGKTNQTFTIPASVRQVSRGFHSTKYLEEVIVPDGVLGASPYSFAGSSIKRVVIGKGLREVSGMSFGSGLESITVSPDNSNLSSDGGVLYDKGKQTLLCYPSAKTSTTFIVPSSVVNLSSSSFARCKYLEHLTFEGKLQSVPSSAFNYAHHGSNGVGSLRVVVFSVGVNVAGFDSDALWASNVLLVGDASVKQIAEASTAYGFDGVSNYTNGDISSAVATEGLTVQYLGSAVFPQPTVSIGSCELVPFVDYDVAYRNNSKPGKGYIDIKGKGVFRGSKTITFDIIAPIGSSAGAWRSYKTTNGISWRYEYNNGSYAVDWALIGGDYYYFNDRGYLVSEQWLNYGGNSYYLQSNGAAAKGWKQIGSNHYYFSSKGGAAARGLVSIDGCRYYFSPTSNAMATGWQTIGAKRYYFSTVNGKAASGLVKIGDYRYYFGPTSNAMATGWQAINGKWYYFSKVNGRAASGFVTIDGNKYYFGPVSNAMATGWQTIGTKRYYFSTVNGKAASGLVKIGDYRYYFGPTSNAMATGWQAINGKWYYFSKVNGRAASGFVTIDGNKYYFGPVSNAMATGWVTIGERDYYFNKETGVLETSRNSAA